MDEHFSYCSGNSSSYLYENIVTVDYVNNTRRYYLYLHVVQ